MLRRRTSPHQNVEKREVENEKPVGEWNKFSPRHARHDGGEEGIGDKHRHEGGGEHPRQGFESIARGDAVANRPHDVVAGQDEKVKSESEPEGADFFRTNVDDLL